MKNLKHKKLIKIISSIICIAVVVLLGVVIYCQAYTKNKQFNKIDDLLYECYYDNYSYNITNTITKSMKPKAACSSISNGDIFARNFDWLNDNSVDFVVHTTAKKGRHAVLGVASMVPNIDKEFIESGKFSAMFYALPILLVDGINDCGLTACVNTVPEWDCGTTTGTNKKGKDICSGILVRYVLDYASSVDEAVKLINSLNVYSLEYEDEVLELHLMIADGTKTAVVEFVNNEVKVTYDHNYMTNYYLTVDGYTPHSQGIERYSIITENYDKCNTVEGAFDTLKKLYYTNIYDIGRENFWYSDYYCVSEEYGDFNINSDKTEADKLIKEEVHQFEKGDRDGESWETHHTSIYDRSKLELTVSSAQGDKQYKFSLNDKK